MVTISEEIKRLVMASPFLEEGLTKGIINLSALARMIRPDIESALKKKVSDSAVLMALKRYAEKIELQFSGYDDSLKGSGDLTVRSGLVEYTFLKSGSIVEKQKRLLHEIGNGSEYFLTFTQSLFEITIIANASMGEKIETIFSDEKRISRLEDLSAIIIKLQPAVVHCPGAYYSVLKQLAIRGINVVEVVSTFTEFTIILKRKDVDVSFSILLNYLSGD